MNCVTPNLKSFAERLLELEATQDTVGVAPTAPAFRVCEKLRRPLSRLTGSAGFQALLGRALILAKAEAPALQYVQLKPNGSLDDMINVKPQAGQPQFSQHEVILIGHLVGLLVTFIGGTLTLRILHDVWPIANFDAMNFEKGTNS